MQRGHPAEDEDDGGEQHSPRSVRQRTDAGPSSQAATQPVEQEQEETQDANSTPAAMQVEREEGADQTCCVCLETITPPVGRMIQCGHTAHHDCISDWLVKKSSTCPIDRRQVEELQKLDESGAVIATQRIEEKDERDPAGTNDDIPSDDEEQASSGEEEDDSGDSNYEDDSSVSASSIHGGGGGGDDSGDDDDDDDEDDSSSSGNNEDEEEDEEEEADGGDEEGVVPAGLDDNLDDVPDDFDELVREDQENQGHYDQGAFLRRQQTQPHA